MTGFAMCGSFCSFEGAFSALCNLKKKHGDVVPIMSHNAYETDTRFGKSSDWNKKISGVCQREIIHTICEAEPLGPKSPLDVLIICPCTGNTLSKIANGITDTPVCMAAKAHLRTDRPLIIALASNDAMSANLSNISRLLMRKNVYFVPMHQDDPIKKPHSLVADFGLVDAAVEAALEGKQLRKLFI